MYRRHFLQTAKDALFSPEKMDNMISGMCAQVDDVIAHVSLCWLAYCNHSGS